MESLELLVKIYNLTLEKAKKTDDPNEQELLIEYALEVKAMWCFTYLHSMEKIPKIQYDEAFCKCREFGEFALSYVRGP